MTADGHFQVPLPVNEPVRNYAPGLLVSKNVPAA